MKTTDIKRFRRLLVFPTLIYIFSVVDASTSLRWPATNTPTLEEDWGEPNHASVAWRQGFRHPTRNECMGWLAQILEEVGV